MADAVTVIRIDVDQNTELAKALRIDGLLVLHLYKNSHLKWSHTGYIEKEKVLANLK